MGKTENRLLITEISLLNRCFLLLTDNAKLSMQHNCPYVPGIRIRIPIRSILWIAYFLQVDFAYKTLGL